MKKLMAISLVAALAAAISGCCCGKCGVKTCGPAPFGTTKYGEKAHLWTVKGKGGMEMSVTDYGGKVVSLTAPDKNGKFEDVVIGFDNAEGWDKTNPYFGALIGRYGNRIKDGKFTLDGKEYELSLNDEPGGVKCHLHGGTRGWDSRMWEVEKFECEKTGNVGFILRLHSPDGEEGYPGNVDVTVTYTITPDNKWLIDYVAMTDAPTHINMTQHSYFNLRGESAGNILNHWLKLNADNFTFVDASLIPTGELKPVEGTALDFRMGHKIGERIDADCWALKGIGGYDHNFAINGGLTKELKLAATLWEESTGRELKVYTTEPGLQVYSGQCIDNAWKGKKGGPLFFRGGIALETQHFPASPNIPAFDSTVVTPEKPYESHTVYAFGIHK